MIINLHNELLWGNARLPSAYQEVEWIQGMNSGPYINLQWTSNAYNSITVEYELSYAEISNTAILGATAPNSSSYRFLVSNGYWYWQSSASGWAQHSYSTVVNTFHKVKIELDSNANTINITEDGVLVKSYTWVNPANLGIWYLFARNYTGTAQKYGDKKFKSFKITADGVVVRDMIPCYKKATETESEEIGMYDLVSKTFFTNAGTGTFTKGADVN